MFSLFPNMIQIISTNPKKSQKKSSKTQRVLESPLNTDAPKNKQRTRCEVWTRVMGYHRPVANFNLGKKSEHYSRKHFTETACHHSESCEKNIA